MEKEKENSENFLKTTSQTVVEGWQSHPWRNRLATYLGAFTALGGTAEFAIAKDEKNALIFIIISGLINGTILADSFVEGRIRRREQESRERKG